MVRLGCSSYAFVHDFIFVSFISLNQGPQQPDSLLLGVLTYGGYLSKRRKWEGKQCLYPSSLLPVPVSGSISSSSLSDSSAAPLGSSSVTSDGASPISSLEDLPSSLPSTSSPNSSAPCISSSHPSGTFPCTNLATCSCTSMPATTAINDGKTE